MARLYPFPGDQPVHPSRIAATIAAELNAVIRHVRRVRTQLARNSRPAAASELRDIATAIQDVRDRVLVLAAEGRRMPAAGGDGAAASRVPVAGAGVGSLLQAAARALEAGIAQINNLAQGLVPTQSGEGPCPAVDELRLLVRGLADIRTHLLDVRRAVGDAPDRSTGHQSRE